MPSPAISTLFCNVLLPVPIPRLFTYRVPSEFNQAIQLYQRVIVPFGAKKILTGIIAEIHENPPRDYEAKSLLDLLDPVPIIFQQQVNFFRWISSYYMCTTGEVLNAALPSGLKLSSESMVQINPAFDFNNPSFDFSEKEWLLLHRLKNDTLSYTEVSKFLGVKNIYTLLKSLNSKEAILLIEEVREKYKPKKIKKIRFAETYVPKKKMEELFESISSKPKQEAVLLKILQDVPIFQKPELNQQGISKTSLLTDDISDSALKSLLKQKVLEEFEVIVSRFQEYESSTQQLPALSEIQLQARDTILEFFQNDKPVLLHGVTGSGKTEIYIDLISKAMENNLQALLLLPEIALSTQIVARLKKVFGSQLGVYHSRFSDNERVETWNGIVQGKLKCVVGVRSSIFLPFDNLGLIIVDEEHDTSYKQDKPPRYHARSSALMLAKLHNARILLGSATPSLESFFHAKRETYGLVTIGQRFKDSPMPNINLINLAEERMRKSLKGSLSSKMISGIESTLNNKEQVILFQNRRGYSPFVECEDCGYVPKCANCSVSLTYHQFKHSLECHYCGYHEMLPGVCPSCSGNRLISMGLGTEKLEEEIKLTFPNASILRMDLDTTRTKTGYANIIESFEEGKTEILIGTQMVSKGLDFGNVNLVGVFDADRLLHFPDFRSYERAFQLIMQVSGRSGRRAKKGQVLIQTYNPNHHVFDFILSHDVIGFLNNQLEDRSRTFYPPYSRLIQIIIKHVDRNICFKAAGWFFDRIVSKDIRILGPAEPAVSKIRNEYLQIILIKMPLNFGLLDGVKAQLKTTETKMKEEKAYRSVKLIFDVDPN